jgi:dihydropteroate synthase
MTPMPTFISGSTATPTHKALKLADQDPAEMNRLTPRPRYDWQLRSRRIALGERTLIMAILNLTPDSFSGDGLLQGVGSSLPRSLQAAATKLAVAAAVAAWDEGADILDLGAESTRPDSTPLTAAEEQDRLLPVLESLLRERPDAIISVDTFHASTAKVAAKLGAEIINDVSGLTWDDDMGKELARSRCGFVLMHTRGRPNEWRDQSPLAHEEVVPSIFLGLCEGIALAEACGIDTENLVVDPGFGFGKLGSENFALLAQLSRLHQLNRPMLVGLSRKRFLSDAVTPVQEANLPPATSRRTATIAAHTAAVLAGAHILRVHDIQPAREAAAVADAMLATVTG